MGYGTGAVLKGAAEGLASVNAGLDRMRDREYQDQTRALDLESKQVGLKKTKTDMARAEVVAGREDQQYERNLKMQDFQDSLDDAVRVFASSEGANYQPLQDVYNNKFPDGGKVHFSRNPDGTFDMVVRKDGDTQVREGLSMDDVAIGAMALRDPQRWLETQEADRAATKKGKVERDKLKYEYQLKGELERVKAGLTKQKDRAEGKVPPFQKDLYARAKDAFGTLAGTEWSFDSALDKNMAAYTAFLSTKIAEGQSEVDVNAAHLRSLQTVQRLEAAAKQAADEQQIQDPDERERYIDDYINQGVTDLASRLKPAKGGGGVTKPKPDAQPSTVDFTSLPEDEQALATDELQAAVEAGDEGAKAEFDEIFGAGAADQVLGTPTKDVGLKRPAKSDQAAVESGPDRKALEAAQDAAAVDPGLRRPEKKGATKKPAKAKGKLSEQVKALAIPKPKFDSSRGGYKAKTEYDKSVAAISSKVENKYRTGTLGKVDTTELRMALNGDLREVVQRAVVAELNKREE